MAAPSNAGELHMASSHGAWQPKAATMAEEWGSPSLRLLADRLRHYRVSERLGFGDLGKVVRALLRWRVSVPRFYTHRIAITEDDAHGGVTSSVGMPTSMADANNIKWLPNQKRAAVLPCLFQGAGDELRVILTKRAGSLSSHSGEVALPGGKRDEGDKDDKATALREAQEEIGLEPSHVKMVTVLEPFLSKHLLTVTPVIAILPEHHKFEPRPNAGEVDAIFDVLLEMFLKDERHRFEDRQWLDVKYRTHFFEFEAADGKKFTIWGLTASILIRAASIILQRPAHFPEFNPNFDILAEQAMQGKDHKM